MPRVVPFTSAENDAHVIEFPRVGDVRHVVVRTVEIDVVVVIAIEKRADIDRAAEGNEMTDGIGMAKGDIGGVIGAETRASNRHARHRVGRGD